MQILVGQRVLLRHLFNEGLIRFGKTLKKFVLAQLGQAPFTGSCFLAHASPVVFLRTKTFFSGETRTSSKTTLGGAARM